MRKTDDNCASNLEEYLNPLPLRGTQNLWLDTLGNLRGNNILEIQDSPVLVVYFFLFLSPGQHKERMRDIAFSRET
jgi:hypothetical protein